MTAADRKKTTADGYDRYLTGAWEPRRAEGTRTAQIPPEPTELDLRLAAIKNRPDLAGQPVDINTVPMPREQARKLATKIRRYEGFTASFGRAPGQTNTGTNHYVVSATYTPPTPEQGAL